jgi:hypothetical protein
MIPVTWMSPQFIEIVLQAAAVVLAATQVVKKIAEKVFTVKPLLSVILSVIVTFVVCFPYLGSDGLVGYLIVVACTALAANGAFKVVKVAGGE